MVDINGELKEMCYCFKFIKRKKILFFFFLLFLIYFDYNVILCNIIDLRRGYVIKRVFFIFLIMGIFLFLNN